MTLDDIIADLTTEAQRRQRLLFLAYPQTERRWLEAWLKDIENETRDEAREAARIIYRHKGMEPPDTLYADKWPWLEEK